MQDAPTPDAATNPKSGEEAKQEASEKPSGKEATLSTSAPNSPATEAVQGATSSGAGPGEAQGESFDAAKAIATAMAKMGTLAKEKCPRSMPVIKMQLRYKPMEHVTKAAHFFKYVPSVFSDSLNFDFDDCDYELVDRDRLFLKDLNARLAQANGVLPAATASQPAVEQEPITEEEFERFIDCVEKIFQRTKDKQDAVMVRHFYEQAPEDLAKKIKQGFLTGQLLPYWKKGKRFTRKFWENPDANDPDMTAAFRKRNDPPKMQLRRNVESLK